MRPVPRGRRRQPDRRRSSSGTCPSPPRLRRLIGPSVILVGVGVASGEYILFPYIASKAGLVFLWAAVVGVAIQFFINMEIERYTLATGQTAITGFQRLWKPFGLILVLMALLATTWPGWATSAATVATFLFGGGDAEHDRHRRAAGHRDHAHGVAGRLPDGRAPGVPEDRRAAAVHRDRAVRGGERHGLQRHERDDHELRHLPRTRWSWRSWWARSRLPARAAPTTSSRATGSATRASGWASYAPRIVSPITGEEEAAPSGQRYSFPRDEENMSRWREWWRRANLEQFVSFAVGRPSCRSGPSR